MRASGAGAAGDLLGEPREAEARLIPLLDGPGQEDPELVSALALSGWAAALLGEEARANLLIQDGLQRATLQRNQLARVDALRIQAMLRVRQKRWAEAGDALEEAITLASAMPYPYAEAKSLYVYG